MTRQPPASRFLTAVVIACSTGAGVAPLRAFPPQDDRVAFVTASVTPHQENKKGGIPLLPGGGFVLANVTLRSLIETAYRRHAFDRVEILGGPAWIDADRFDIEAKAPGEHELDADGFPRRTYAMLRALLVDRFKLKVRIDRKESPVYHLTVATPGKDGPRLRRSEVDCRAFLRMMIAGEGPPKPTCAFAMYPGRFVGTALTMTQVASILSPIVNRTIVDKTGLTGNFDVELEAVEIRPNGPFGPSYRPSDTRDSIFETLPAQLGLKLEAATGPVETFTIEHVEKLAER
jgi:uncharacterized protein (TIGR03435 family)